MDREKSRKSVDKQPGQGQGVGVGNTANPPMKSSNSNKMDDVSRLMMALNESLEGVLSNSTRKALIEYLKVNRLKYIFAFSNFIRMEIFYFILFLYRKDWMD
jgi:hypothetical protein